MTLYFPDVNVWLALSVKPHTHSAQAWRWFEQIPSNSSVLFSRFSQLGLLRLLTNSSVMGGHPLNLSRAWAVYDRWLADPRVRFGVEPAGVELMLRAVAGRREQHAASKVLGDCYLLAFSAMTKSVLVTFDRGLYRLAQENSSDVLIPG